MSGTFRKKQRVYMDSTFVLAMIFVEVRSEPLLVELQGHATKNKDLLIAAGTVPMSTSQQISEVDDDVQAVSMILIFSLHETT